MRGLEEDEWLVLSLKNRHRFVQFMNQGGAGFRAETVSDYYLKDDDRLSEDNRAMLLKFGWHTPTNLPDEFGLDPDGSPNYFVDLANPAPFYDQRSNQGESKRARSVPIADPGRFPYGSWPGWR